MYELLHLYHYKLLSLTYQVQHGDQFDQYIKMEEFECLGDQPIFYVYSHDFFELGKT